MLMLFKSKFSTFLIEIQINNNIKIHGMVQINVHQKYFLKSAFRNQDK